MTKYHMRRVEKEIKDKENLIEILKRGKYAIISMCKKNEPYIVTLSYGYNEETNSLYIHCSKEGQKIDFLNFNPYICGTVIEDNGYEEGCGQAFRSIVFRGKIKIIEDIKEKKRGFEVLLNHLEKDPNRMREKFFKKEDTYQNTGMLRLDITDITGKEEKAENL